MPTPLPDPFSDLSPADFLALSAFLEPANHEAGDQIVAAGEPGDGCLFIDEGLVRLEVPLDHLDNDVTLGYLEPGEILGELALLDHQPRSVSAFAETPVTARRLDRAALDQLLTREPRVGARVLACLGRDAARKLRETNTRLIDYLQTEGTDPEVEELVARAKAAQETFVDVDEAVVDALLTDLATAFADAARELAEDAVKVTNLGNVDDKTVKNTFAARAVHRYVTGQRGIGELGPGEGEGVTDVAAPAGVIFALIPVTNPIATAIFTVLSALKARNAVIMSFHRVCLPLAERCGEIVHAALEQHGVSTDLVQWVRKRASRQKTAMFMGHRDVDLILATGGPGMVRAAYSSGTPALGVGPGNAPCWIAPDADVMKSAFDIVFSKAFDNGLICGAEHNLVVDAAVREAFCAALEECGAAVLTPEEAATFLGAVVIEDGSGYRPEVFGQAAETIASFLGISREGGIGLLVVPWEPDLSHPITSEKMSPFLSLFTVDGDDEALALSKALLDKMGTGHTAIIHSTDEGRIARFARTMPASRILVNAGGSTGVSGIASGLPPSLTLGCGTFGGNSTTDNVTFRNLRNVKRLARGLDPDPWLMGADA